MIKRNPYNYIGKKYGKLTIISVPEQIGGTKVNVKCDCGKADILVTLLSNLITGRYKSCGCIRYGHKKHGYCYTPEYRAWYAALSRCIDPRHNNYENYGGRGITMCDEWAASFEAFLAYIGKRPSNNLSLDRINNNGNYEPGNVRWADAKTQANNKRK